MKRLPDWELRLETLVQERLCRPFAWGVHDCCLWAADVVLAVTGVDLAHAERGAYGSALAAARVLEPMGGVLGLATARLGAVAAAVDVRCAQVGDVGVVLQPGAGHTLVACLGPTWWGAGEHGLLAWPAADVLQAWSVAGGA